MQRDYPKIPLLINSFGSELNQVWTNIIDNAIDAMSGKGELRVRAYREDPCVVVEIGDNGPGISPEVKDHIFEPFFHHQGSGRGDWSRPRYGSANCEKTPRKHSGNFEARRHAFSHLSPARSSPSLAKTSAARESHADPVITRAR